MATEPAWKGASAGRGTGETWREDAETRLLVQRIQGGERELAALLYERYFDRVYAYLRSSLRRGADAEDIAQQAFANALAALDRYDPDRGSFRAWLFVIAQNQLSKFLRGTRRIRLVAPDDLAGFIERKDCAPDPAGRVSDGGMLAAVAKLPERQRQVLLLRFVADLKPGEIAEVLGISGAAVAQAQNRALACLRERHEPSAGRGHVFRAHMAARTPVLPVLRARRLALLAKY